MPYCPGYFDCVLTLAFGVSGFRMTIGLGADFCVYLYLIGVLFFGFCFLFDCLVFVACISGHWQDL